MEALISVEKLSYYYGNREILHNISLKIAEASFIALVGPNGSGKTTFLKNLSSYLVPQKGQILLNQEDLFKINQQKLAQQMAVVPQSSPISFPFTVLDTVLMGRFPHQKKFQGDSPRDLSIARWALKLTNTWHLRNRLITELSGGEKQRVIVAQALAQEPRILLLDEPTSHLDLKHQLDLLELLQTLNRTASLTVVAALHDLNLAAQYGTYIVLLKDGQIYAAGQPEKVLTPKYIREVYGIEVKITPNGSNGRFHIIPVGKTKTKVKEQKKLRVHLITGGGQGQTVMEQLVEEGYQVSCGVLNIGDSDWNMAKALGLAVVEEAPFTAISPEVYEKNRELLMKADIIVILPTLFGPGNLGNLKLAQIAGEAGKKVLLIDSPPISQRDFTAGKATAIYEEMSKKHQKITTTAELLDILADETIEKTQGGTKQ